VIHNPYWDELRNSVTEDPDDTFYGGPIVDWFSNSRIQRSKYVSRFAWTITDPETVEFVAKHAGTKVIDPLAGTGYWAYLLDQCNIMVAAYDLAPVGGPRENYYHKNDPARGTVTQLWYQPLVQANAPEIIEQFPLWTLLLSWPPYGDDVGAETVKAYRGDRIIYIGEGSYGCCGDDKMFEYFESDWEEVADHRPIQYSGMHDYVWVYDRKIKELER
jgi:hypothetical protein